MQMMSFLRGRSLKVAMGVLLGGPLLAALLAGGTDTGRATIRGAGFVVRAAGMQGPARSVASWNTTTVTAMSVVPIPWRGGTLKSRAYQPYRASGRGVRFASGSRAARSR